MKADIYKCPCGYGWDKSKVVRHHFCPNCGRAVNSTEQEPCTDAISRKAVLDAISSDRYDYLALLEYVKQLSPVTPQYTDAEIQKMQDLEFAEVQKAYELGKAEMQPCEDCISRQAVEDAIANTIVNGESLGYAVASDILSDLPPVTPAEKVGQWIDGKCNRCGTHAPYWAMASTYYCSEYCPKCGAKMQEVEA